MNGQIGGIDKYLWPHPGGQLFFADEFARPLNQRNEDIKRATSQLNRLIPIQQKPLSRQQAERTE
jgi:hypothetical protein